MYVNDAANMTLFFLENRQSNGVFNIGSGSASTWNELAAAIFRAMGKEERIEYIDMPDSVRNRYQYYTCANMSKLRNSGYCRPITSLFEAVDDYVKNYLVSDRRLGQ